MLQSDFPGKSDGSAFYALGTYNEAAGTFDGATGLDAPRALDFSETYVYNQLGYRADGSMVNAGWIRNLGTSVTRAVTFDPALGAEKRLFCAAFSFTGDLPRQARVRHRKPKPKRR